MICQTCPHSKFLDWSAASLIWKHLGPAVSFILIAGCFLKWTCLFVFSFLYGAGRPIFMILNILGGSPHHFCAWKVFPSAPEPSSAPCSVAPDVPGFPRPAAAPASPHPPGTPSAPSLLSPPLPPAPWTAPQSLPALLSLSAVENNKQRMQQGRVQTHEASLWLPHNQLVNCCVNNTCESANLRGLRMKACPDKNSCLLLGHLRNAANHFN